MRPSAWCRAWPLLHDGSLAWPAQRPGIRTRSAPSLARLRSTSLHPPLARPGSTSRDPAAPASGPRAPAPSLARALAPRDSAPSGVPLVASVQLDRLPSTATPAPATAPPLPGRLARPPAPAGRLRLASAALPR
nr:translation initiation factor IF-2-like [Aegilops tauschii subsp. strangulata]